MGKTKDFDEVIRKAVEAGRVSAERNVKDAYKATERRLYAYPTLKQKLEDDLERLAEIREFGPRGTSKSVVRYQKGGVRLDPEEILDTVIMNMEATIAADQEEIEAVERAVACIVGDDYYRCVEGRYFEGLEDEDIAREIGCEATTLWRNRKRLVQKLSVLFYGAAAVR